MNPLHLLLSIQAGGGDSTAKALYQEAKAFLSDLSSSRFLSFIEGGKEGDLIKWKIRKAMEYDSDHKPIGLLTPYKGLTLEELLLVFEVCGFTNYAQLTSSKTWRGSFSPDGIVKGVLQDARPSIQVKLAIVCGTLYRGKIVTDWLCFNDEGEHIEEAAKLLAGNGYNDGVAIEVHINNTIEGIINTAVDRMYTRDEGQRFVAVIEGFSEKAVTKNFFSALVNVVERNHRPYQTARAHSTVARHARRIYNFDESIPDDWVLEAIK